MSNTIKTAEGRVRSSESRLAPEIRRPDKSLHRDSPAAGAHAAIHLVNEDSTPGAGALPSYSHPGGKEVDGAAG